MLFQNKNVYECISEASTDLSQQSFFYGEELWAPRPTPKLEDHPLSALRDCLFSIFAATLHT
jgi:hypothetical protein